MYYIYDNDNEEFVSIAYAYFEDAETHVEYLQQQGRKIGIERSFDIFKKIT